MTELKNEAKRKKLRIPKYLIRFLIKIAVVVLAVFLTTQYVFGVFVNRGNDMFPSVKDGDLIITYKLEDVYVNEAVAYKYDGDTYFGRIVGREGDVIGISDIGELTVNGTRPSEQVFYATYPADISEIRYPYTVPEGCVFILCDFRTTGIDSRLFGAVNKKDLLGKMIFVLRRRGI